jgi:hypothetical protein
MIHECKIADIVVVELQGYFIGWTWQLGHMCSGSKPSTLPPSGPPLTTSFQQSLKRLQMRDIILHKYFHRLVVTQHHTGRSVLIVETIKPVYERGL